jgi:hypothetical protein
MDVLDRLFARLQKGLAARSGEPDDPLTVADLYQRLIPYRSVRSELGLLELAPYEHALLRLLAGERGLLTIREPGVVQELRRELAEPNPILGVYRDYAETEVHLSSVAETGGGRREAAEYVAPPLPMTPILVSDLSTSTLPAPSETARAPAADRPAPPRDDPAADRPDTPQDDTLTAGECIRCREELPMVADLRFCPSCGSDQSEPACPGCGSPVRSGWQFCIRCGQRQGELPLLR